MPCVLPKMQLQHVYKPSFLITLSAGNCSHVGGGPSSHHPNSRSSFRNQSTNKALHAERARTLSLGPQNRCKALNVTIYDSSADLRPHLGLTTRPHSSNSRGSAVLVSRDHFVSLTPRHFSVTRQYAGTVDIGFADSEIEEAQSSGMSDGSLPGCEPSITLEKSSASILAEGHTYQIREAMLTDLRAAASVQADVFYEGGPIPAWDGLFLKFFQAEVYDTLLQKVRHSVPGRYACLVATRKGENHEEKNREHDVKNLTKEIPKLSQDVVGIVDIAALNDSSVLRELEEVDEYLYVSGMAVATSARRSGVGSLLLEGVEKRGLEWGFHYLVLHVYEDNTPARELYRNSGYLALATDPIWNSRILGRRRRVLMAKRIRIVRPLEENIESITTIER